MSERKYTDEMGRSKYPGWPPPRGVIRDLPLSLYHEHRHLDTGRGLDIGLVRRIEDEARAEMAETVAYCRDCARALPAGYEEPVCDSCQEFTERARETRVKALMHRWENGLSLTWLGCKHTEAEARVLLGLGENRTPYDPVEGAWSELHAVMNGYGQRYVRSKNHIGGDPLVALYETAADAYDREHPLYGQWPDAV